ncbi:MAG: hypothetical protein IT305_19760 [Chloroflexi bacterium]|nr:hypothetical protein [Chloroflexota bacterium]
MSSIARILGAMLAVALVVMQPAAPVAAQAAPYCAAGQAPAFVNGFADLKDQLGPIMGEPVECEHTNGANGDVLQQTTTGLAFWRKSSNTPTFTDGFHHWALTSRGLVAWDGEAIEPPATANVVTPGGTGRGAGAGQIATGSGNTIGSGRGRAGVVSPPSASASRRTTPTTYIYRTIDRPPPDNEWPCLRSNPSCGRENWWQEWNESQDSQPMQFRYIGPGLVAEGRFAEAIGLIWQWPEGRELLQSAADYGVAIVNSPEISRRAFAAYRPSARTLYVNPYFTEVSTWLLADVLAHELRHASDDRTGTRMGNTYGDCIAREQAAFQTEARFVRWLVDRQGEFPSPDEVSKVLSQEDFALYMDISKTISSENLDAQVEAAYRQTCSR